jgi:hypothetical protein
MLGIIRILRGVCLVVRLLAPSPGSGAGGLYAGWFLGLVEMLIDQIDGNHDVTLQL